MNFVTIDHVIKTATKHNAMVWTVWDSAGEKLDAQLSQTKQTAASLDELRECVNGTAGDYVKIQVSTKKLGQGGDQTTGVFRYNVKCATQLEETTAATVKTTAAAAGSADIYTLLADMRVKLAQQEKDVEIRELQREVKELKEGGKNGKHKMLERYLEKVLLSETVTKKTAAPGINGVTGTKKNTEAAAEPTTDEKKAAAHKLAAALNRMKKVDVNFIANLEKVATFAEKNPDKYQEILTML